MAACAARRMFASPVLEDASARSWGQACECCVVEWLMATWHVPVSVRYQTARAGDEKDRIGSLQQNIGDLKRRIAIQSNIENRPVHVLAPTHFEGVSNASERANRLTAQAADQFLQLHGNERLVFDEEQSQASQRLVRLAELSCDLVAHHCGTGSNGNTITHSMPSR